MFYTFMNKKQNVFREHFLVFFLLFSLLFMTILGNNYTKYRMIKNKTLGIKISFKNIKNKLKAFQVSNKLFFFTKFKK